MGKFDKDPTSETDLRNIHTWFNLTYANYLVLPRSLLQSMPEEWQHRFVTCLEQLDAAFDHVEQAEAYNVTTGVDREVGELSDDELKCLGITRAGRLFHDRNGREMERDDVVLWPTPDPVPHYNRGRTHIEPQLTTT